MSDNVLWLIYLCFIYITYVLLVYVLSICLMSNLSMLYLYVSRCLFTSYLYVLCLVYLSCICMLHGDVYLCLIYMCCLLLVFFVHNLFYQGSSNHFQKLVGNRRSKWVDAFPWHLYLAYHFPSSSPCSFITWYLSLSGKKYLEEPLFSENVLS